MIESELKREKITQTIERWAEHTKIKQHLRDHDIPGLVSTILTEFYHIHLSCGHMVSELDEGIMLEFHASDGGYFGFYCHDCATKFVEADAAREGEQ